MTEEAKHRKITTGVSQIGRLVGHCAKHDMTVSDIMIMIQTATSLVCEMNNIDIVEYMKFLYVLHKRRIDESYDSDGATINAELASIFAIKPAIKPAT